VETEVGRVFGDGSHRVSPGKVAEAMPSAGLAGWDQAGQQHRKAQPHMASM
jgi:hypothetical protein